MTHSTKTISPLRQRMIEDTALRKLSPQTQAAYVRVVKNFARFLGRSPDTASAEDLRQYQLHLVEQGIASGNLNATITGLKFFFGKFGQGKNGYRLNYIRAKRAETSVTWINTIFLVMNLLILLRLFFALCVKGLSVILWPPRKLEKSLQFHQMLQTVTVDALCSQPD